ncbi:uncharacterized protein LOC143377803 [Andrena cerasifolii]|uniref:uncharacterized protein LOC143377803 n=1 Tax=Andrena cerasifolii TaxID=2819439 RepID=UPI00403805AC
MRLAKKLKRGRLEKERALYVRLPHVIRNQEDVAKLFTGDFKVKLLRQSSRHCFVVFPDVEEKMRNLNAAKKTVINGKRVVVSSAITKRKNEPRKIMRKKIVVPKVKQDVKVTRTMFVSNIKCGTKLAELKAAIPGCVSVKMLKPYSQNFKSAIIKMESAQLAAEYLKQIKESPIVGGHTLRMNPDTRTRHRNPKSSATLKIYDGGTESAEEPSKERQNETLDYILLENKS